MVSTPPTPTYSRTPANFSPLPVSNVCRFGSPRQGSLPPLASRLLGQHAHLGGQTKRLDCEPGSSRLGLNEAYTGMGKCRWKQQTTKTRPADHDHHQRRHHELRIRGGKHHPFLVQASSHSEAVALATAHMKDNPNASGVVVKLSHTRNLSKRCTKQGTLPTKIP